MQTRIDRQKPKLANQATLSPATKAGQVQNSLRPLRQELKTPSTLIFGFLTEEIVKKGK